jgi:hypothetical protein
MISHIFDCLEMIGLIKGNYTAEYVFDGRDPAAHSMTGET